MTYTLPRLPYLDDELEPAISARTVSFHYGVHTRTYIDNLNRLIKDTEYADMPLEEIINTAPAGPLFNNAAQTWNHLFYFFQLSPEPKKIPSVELMEAICEEFGDFDEFKKKFESEGTAVFGSGWVWLCVDANKKPVIVTTGNAGNPMTDGLTPIMVADVWEHAYYLDYQNRRAEYLKKFWDVLDWKEVDRRYADLFE
ncbi:MAG: superoxide dismutase [Bacteroides sp.]|nr:superoxide dismutase [Bacteroidales bacterium]MBD5337063.1 superoxide dismutase [Bacteroides sp.]